MIQKTTELSKPGSSPGTAAAESEADSAENSHALGDAHLRAGRFEEAVESYRGALLNRPAQVATLNNLSIALKTLGRLDEARDALRRAAELRPESPELATNLGNLFKEIGQLDDAIASYERSLALRPADSETLVNLAATLRETGEVEQAIDLYEQAVKIRPDFTVAHNGLLYTALFSATENGAEIPPPPEGGGRGRGLDHEGASRSSKTPHPLKGGGSNTSPLARREVDRYARWNALTLPFSKNLPPHLNDRDPNRRLRIGYVSPNFCGHAVGRFLLPLLAHHDRTHFEINAYSDTRRPDAMTDRLRSHCDHWHATVGLTDEQLADQIRADRIDILIDLNLHMAQSRLLTFARKPAPVQITYLAYCGTSGLTAMDYRISDPYLDPTSANETDYTEQTLRLPTSYWCYPAPDNAPDVNAPPMLQNRYVTFGCLNNCCKASDPAIDTWIEILKAVPKSRLLLHAHEGQHRNRLRLRLAAQSIDPDRVQFVGFQPFNEYLAQYHAIDIALDPFPYAGGTTTCDALWMGVPVISLIGTTAISRSGLSILSNVGLPELAATTRDAYVEIAGQLATNPERLATLRKSLRSRMQGSPLMDGHRFTRELETLYRDAWSRWCAKLAGVTL